ncbi:MAG: TetR/AcrR family transcriptional regulator [Nitrospirales bacterium]|nr:TetR/AcrR family transcriptional regulator [Nitrospirales bacterium]
MGIIERKERQKESLRQDILDAARNILITEGYARLSMRSIASRIEYSPTTIYLYFKNKEDILYFLCEEALERQLEVITAADKNESSPDLRLRSILKAYIDFGLSEPDRYKIIYMIDISQHVSTASLLAQGKAADKLRGIVRRRLDEVLIESGQTSDSECLFQAIWAHLHGIVSLLIGRPDFPWVDRNKLIETSIDITVKGFVSDKR